MKTGQFFFSTSQRKIPRNKFVLNMIGNQNNNAFKDWVIVTTDFLFFNTRWVNSLEWNRPSSLCRYTLFNYIIANLVNFVLLLRRLKSSIRYESMKIHYDSCMMEVKFKCKYLTWNTREKVVSICLWHT